jgi:hypothetical protein
MPFLIYPAFSYPTGTPHASTEDDVYEYEGVAYSIPKGSTMLVNLWSVNRDPEYYPEPDTFRPERFLEGSELYDKFPVKSGQVSRSPSFGGAVLLTRLPSPTALFRLRTSVVSRRATRQVCISSPFLTPSIGKLTPLPDALPQKLALHLHRQAVMGFQHLTQKGLEWRGCRSFNVRVQRWLQLAASPFPLRHSAKERGAQEGAAGGLRRGGRGVATVGAVRCDSIECSS